MIERQPVPDERPVSEKAVLVPLDPAAAAAALKRHFTESEIAAIVRLLHWEKGGGE